MDAPRDGGGWIHPLAFDLDHILEHTPPLWEELRGQRLFITGGTGFLGCWLLESFAWAQDKFNLGASAVVLTRDREAFRLKAPHLANHPAINWHLGDVRSYSFPPGPFAYIIHAATQSSVDLNIHNPLVMLDTIVQGTRRTLQFARLCGAKKFLFTSSGAVYGKQPAEITHLPEDYLGAPDPMSPDAAYGVGKRAAEFLCSCYAGKYGLECKIARCFAFVGPYLPLNTHFAVGNFIRDRLEGGPIRVNSDGSPSRSYLYAADMAIWLWTILWKGVPCRPYNVGSEEAISIGELARTVAKIASPEFPVQINQAVDRSKPPDRYVPATGRFRQELGQCQEVGLHLAIRKTIDWHLRVVDGRLPQRAQEI
jgi:nucleoside-diphosphate-sugar epimerase